MARCIMDVTFVDKETGSPLLRLDGVDVIAPYVDEDNKLKMAIHCIDDRWESLPAETFHSMDLVMRQDQVETQDVNFDEAPKGLMDRQGHNTSGHYAFFMELSYVDTKTHSQQKHDDLLLLQSCVVSQEAGLIMFHENGVDLKASGLLLDDFEQAHVEIVAARILVRELDNHDYHDYNDYNKKDPDNVLYLYNIIPKEDRKNDDKEKEMWEGEERYPDI